MKRLPQLLDRFWFASAPASRLAILRILVGSYALYYVGTRYEMLVKIAESSVSLFKPVGVVSLFEKPIPPTAFQALVIITLVANMGFIIGWKHRYVGPLFAALLLCTFCYRNSWSMIYHSHNVLVLHVIILGLTPAADAFSVDSFSRRRLATQGESVPGSWWEQILAGGSQYGWPIQLMCTVTVITYFLAGVAKVASPMSWSWAGGEVLRSQIAVDAMRKELFGSSASPLIYSLYDQLLLFTLMGIGTLLLELGAPVAILNKRLGRLWAINAFLMHWGIFFIMDIKFRYQLAGLIFASFFNVERLVLWFQPRGNAKRLGEAKPTQEAIVLFDGECSFCNGWVRFILDRDPQGRFSFASLQSDVGRSLLSRIGVVADLDSIVLLEGDRIFTQSTAVLRITGRLEGYWRLLYSLVAIPRPVRDAAYRFFAKHRYRWFGLRSACTLPTPRERERFLDLNAIR